MEQMGGRRERGGEIGGRVKIFVRAKCAPLREERMETKGRGGGGVRGGRGRPTPCQPPPFNDIVPGKRTQ